MRKYLPFFVFTILLCTSCAKDNLYKDALMGTWKLQQIKQNEEWVGVSKNPSLQITLTIRPDGSYSTNGYLGNVSGTWHLSKRNLTFYVGEQEYIKCYVTELWWEYCELQFTLNNETIYTLSNAFKNSCIICGIDYGSYSGEARLNLACS